MDVPKTAKEKLIDTTINSSPIPQATSTVRRRGRATDRNNDSDIMYLGEQSQSGMNSSLGLLSLSQLSLNDRESQMLVSRDDRHSLAMQTLQRRHSKYGKQPPPPTVGLPSYLLEASPRRNHTTHAPEQRNNESTISESDFSNPCIVPKFEPSARSSAFGLDIEAERMNLSMMEEFLKNSDLDISAIVEKYLEISSRASSVKNFDGDEKLDNASQLLESSSDFVPGEMVENKLRADELSWCRSKQTGLPVVNVSTFSEAAFDDKMSIGEFFWKKTGAVNDLSLSTSPVKRRAPVPLVETSVVNNDVSQNFDGKDSTVTLSMIRQALPDLNMEDSPNKIIKQIKKKNTTYVKQQTVNEFKLPEAPKKPTAVGNMKNLQDAVRMESYLEQQNYLLSTNNKENNEDNDTNTTADHRSKNQEKSKESLASATCSELEFSDKLQSMRLSLTPPRSCSAQSGSVHSLPGGKLPIESTQTELVWGCVRIGKSATQEFVLRNRASLRLRLSITLSGTSFKILKKGNEYVSTLTIVLHSLESRPITVAFAPSRQGAIVERLVFVPIIQGNEHIEYKRQVMQCYGYGGHVGVDVCEVTKDTGARMWMLLGQLSQAPVLKSSFVLRNVGDLTAFALIRTAPKFFLNLNGMHDVLKIHPTFCVLKPKEERRVSVSMEPKVEDLYAFAEQKTYGNVVDVGCLQIYSGAEATRGRLIRLHAKQRTDHPQNNLLQCLTDKLPTTDIPTDVKSLKESSSSIRQLLKGISQREITLTVEHDQETTLVSTADDTFMFKSIYNETAFADSKNETVLCASPPVQERNVTYTIEPKSITLAPKNNCKANESIVLQNCSDETVRFEVYVEPNHTVTVLPLNGQVGPYERKVFQVSCGERHPEPLQFFKVFMYVENQSNRVDVTVKYISEPQRT